MIYVYINDRKIILGPTNESLNKNTKENIYHEIHSASQLKNLTKHFLEEFPSQNLIIGGKNSSQLYQMFIDIYPLIDASGGVVLNDRQDLLMIYRRHHWDLPKGKTDSGETAEQAAVREVEEETGVINPVIQKPLKDTYHMYQLKGEWVLKRTQWFQMRASHQKLKPQSEEEIETAVWMPRDELVEKIAQTYHSLVPVLEPFIK